MAFLWLAVGFLVLAVIFAILGAFEVGALDMEIAKWLVIIFVVLAVIALVLQPPPGEADSVIGDDPSGDVHRVVDTESEVVCYAYDKGYGAGIDCLPLNHTALTPGGDSP